MVKSLQVYPGIVDISQDKRQSNTFFPRFILVLEFFFVVLPTIKQRYHVLQCY